MICRILQQQQHLSFLSFFCQKKKMCSKESAETLLLSSSYYSSPARWWSKETIAVVTGGNKGIGFAMVKKLAELGLTVILTARDGKKGLEAVETLKRFGIHQNVHFCVLDVSESSSITIFASWFKQNFPALDILINNAAVSFNGIHENSVEKAETVIRTNFYGPKLLIEALLPVFRRSSTVSRILNISSRLGLLNKLKNINLRKMLQEEEQVSEKEIERMVEMFLENVKKKETWQKQGWPEVWTDYSVSKLALNAYSMVLAKRFCGSRLSVNCYCPGFTQTSMTGGKGKYTADDAAEVAVGVALIPPLDLPTGKFFLGTSPTIYSKL